MSVEQQTEGKKPPAEGIPDGWQESTVGNMSTVKGGKRLPKGETLSHSKTPHPYIRVTDMFMGGVNTDSITYVPEHVWPQIRRYTISKDDIFISCAGTIGIVGEVPEVLDGANLTENAHKLTNITCHKRFLLQYLFWENTQSVIATTTTQNAQPKLAIERLQALPILLPPLPEQIKIAAILSTWDESISTLTKLLATKQQQKRGLAEQLLSGKRRLKGFEGEWEEVKLGEIGVFSKGKGLSKDDLKNMGSIYALPYTAIYTDHDEAIQKDRIKHSVSYNPNLSIISKPSLIFASSSNMLENIGKCTAFPGGYELAVGGDTLIFESNAEPVYLAYLLGTSEQRKKIISLAQGATIRHVYSSTFQDFTIFLPSLPEQQAIASILSTLDAEIASLTRLKASVQQQKRGLMDVLLTGRVRVMVGAE